MFTLKNSSPIKWVMGLSILAASVLHAASPEAEGEYDAKSKKLAPAPILVRGVKGEVTATTDAGTTRLEDGARIKQGAVVNTGAKSRVDLIFSNGSVIALDQNSKLTVNQFLQAGGFDIAPPLEVGKGVVDASIPTIGQMQKEPSHSMTRLYLNEGTMYARVKKLNKRSSYVVNTPLGYSKILGTTWKQTVGVDRANLKKKVTLLLQEGLIQFDPLDNPNKPNDPVTIHPNEEIEVSGTFLSIEAMNSALDVAVNTNVSVDIAIVKELIRDPEFAALINDFLPNDRAEQVSPTGITGNTDGADGGFFGGDQGVGNVGGGAGGFGGSGGGSASSNSNEGGSNNAEPPPAS